MTEKEQRAFDIFLLKNNAKTDYMDAFIDPHQTSQRVQWGGKAGYSEFMNTCSRYDAIQIAFNWSLSPRKSRFWHEFQERWMKSPICSYPTMPTNIRTL